MNRANINIIGFGGAVRVGSQGQEGISVEEVKRAVDELKNNKSAGVDEVSTEMIQWSGERALDVLQRIC